VRLTVTDLSPGLPDIPGVLLPARPESVISSPNPWPFRGDPTVVRRTVEFGATQSAREGGS
jgi:hypothetical protein